MNINLTARITQFYHYIQDTLFPFLDDQPITLTPKLQEVVTVLEMLNIARLPLYTPIGAVGRPAKNRHALIRAFVAKAVLNLPTTEALIERLKMDLSLRRICGFSTTHNIPHKSQFSRAFADFAADQLPEKLHAALIKEHLGDQLVFHVSHDSTAIIAREKGQKITHEPREKVAKKRGRPRKDEVRIKEAAPLTRIETQQNQTLAEMLAELPTACDTGTKKNSQGYKQSWRGYKLHIGTADGDIPISCILTSASLHDSQVLIPLMAKSSEHIDYLYDLADAAYCSPLLRAASREKGRVPIIDHNPRRGEKIAFEPHEAERYKARSGVERVNGHLKDHHGGNHVWVRGAKKVMAHLMLGILVITSEQLLRLLT